MRRIFDHGICSSVMASLHEQVTDIAVAGEVAESVCLFVPLKAKGTEGGYMMHIELFAKFGFRYAAAKALVTIPAPSVAALRGPVRSIVGQVPSFPTRAIGPGHVAGHSLPLDTAGRPAETCAMLARLPLKGLAADLADEGYSWLVLSMRRPFWPMNTEPCVTTTAAAKGMAESAGAISLTANRRATLSTRFSCLLPLRAITAGGTTELLVPVIAGRLKHLAAVGAGLGHDYAPRLV